MVSSSRHESAKRLKIGPWAVDLERETVCIGNDASQLTLPAEKVLLFLCAHPNELVTRDQILEAVWPDRVVEDAAITHCIWQIRRMLGEQGKELLQTRAKRGYLLVVPDSAWNFDETAAADDAVAADDTATASSMADTEVGPDASKLRSGTDDPIVLPADAIIAKAAPRHRSRWFVGALLAFVCSSSLLGFFVWRAQTDHTAAPSQMRLTPDAELTVSVIAPEKYAWLSDAIMRVAFEQAYLRDAGVFYFQKRQSRNPFAGPHLQIEVEEADASTAVAQLSLDQSGKTIRRRFRGSANDLAETTEAFLRASLQAPVRTATPATDALVSGLVADSRSDYSAALTYYRQALALDPELQQAKLAMASRLYSLGRSSQALVLWQELKAVSDLSPRQNCQLALLSLKVSDEALGSSDCARARTYEKIQRGDAREVLREVAVMRGRPLGAAPWDAGEHHAIIAHIDLREFAQARSRIDQAQHVASEAGWERVRAEIGGLRGEVELQDGKTDLAASMKTASAAEMEAAGGFAEALALRTDAIRLLPPAPGDAVSEQRAQLNKIIDRAREIGSVRAEVEALYVLLRLDADRAQLWLAHLRRIQTLVESEYAPKLRHQESYYTMIELEAQLQYRDVLEGVRRLNPVKDVYPYNDLGLTMEADAHFERDELPAAVAAIERIQQQKFDLGTTSTCDFARIFAETRLPDRARLMLTYCDYRKFDRTAMSDGGDAGLLAEARLYQLGDRPERAWPTVQPRIDALLAMRDLNRDEAEGLALLARYATSMPGADIARLERALARTSDIAAKDGAGPGLRLGVHLLRWRLCAREGRSDCGPVLPSWGQENAFEARLALDSLPGKNRETNMATVIKESGPPRPSE